MTGTGLAETLIVNLLFVIAAVPLGEWVLTACEAVARRAAGIPRRRPPVSLARIGVVLLVGLAADGYVGVVLGLARIFRAGTIIVAAAVVVVAGHRVFSKYARYLIGRRTAAARSLRDPLIVLGLLAAATLFVANYQAGLPPPTLPDELAYHLPQAEVLVHTHRLPLNLGGHYFYGNLPHVGEVLYAEAIALTDDFSLARVLPMSILGAFLIFVGATLRRLYGGRTGLLAVVLLLSYDDLTQNAASTYVDVAAVCFEIAALVSVVFWLESGVVEDVAAGALLIGLALSVKYTPLFTAAFIAGLVVLGLWRHRRAVSARRLGIVLGATAVIACAFWYGKNAARYGNPFYPLYFGHPGISNLVYSSLVAEIQQFGPRTLHAFIRIPTRFATLSELPTLLAFILAPFALFVRRGRWFLIPLLVFYPVYTAYWFFVATHQARFLMAAVTTATILFAVALMHVERLLVRGAMAAVAAALIVAGPNIAPNRVAVQLILENKLRWPTWRYALGRERRHTYLEQVYGCQYGAIDFLARARLRGAVIDNWTVWHDYSLNVYEKQNLFVNFYPSSERDVLAEAERSGFHFLYLRTTTKRRFLKETDPLMVEYRQKRIGPETALLRHATLIWKEQDCELFRLRPQTA